MIHLFREGRAVVIVSVEPAIDKIWGIRRVVPVKLDSWMEMEKSDRSEERHSLLYW